MALFVANGISLLGNQLTALAIPWLVLTELGTAADAGIVGAGLILPAVIGAIGGGIIIDRVGQRRTSILADLLSGATVAAIPVLSITMGLSIPMLVVIAFLGALLDAPGTTARQVMLPDLADAAAVTRERANGIYMAVENATLVLGPLLAGIIVLAFGPIQALWVDAASFALCAVLVWTFVPRRTRSEAGEQGPTSIDAMLGLRIVARDAPLRALTVVAGIANFAGTPVFVVLLPALAIQGQVDAATLGIMLAAFGGGWLLGSLWFAARGATFDRRRLLAGGFAGAGLGLLLAAIAPSIALVSLALFVAGAASGPINPVAYTVMQERIPEAQRGRVFGAVLGAVLLAAPVGMLTFGFVTEARGPILGLELVGLTFLAVAAIVATRPVFGLLAQPSEVRY
jgi:predicted MFS family arabinose efflux permease